MADLSHLGLICTCIGKLNGVVTWKISGNTRPYASIFKQNKGFWSAGSWRLTHENYTKASESILEKADENPAKKKKTESTLELEKKRDEWEAIASSMDAHGYRWLLGEVFNEILIKKGETAWGSIVDPNEAIHSCGCNVVWELFKRANKDIDKVAQHFSPYCNACGEAFLQ